MVKKTLRNNWTWVSESSSGSVRLYINMFTLLTATTATTARREGSDIYQIVNATVVFCTDSILGCKPNIRIIQLVWDIGRKQRDMLDCCQAGSCHSFGKQRASCQHGYCSLNWKFHLMIWKEESVSNSLSRGQLLPSGWLVSCSPVAGWLAAPQWLLPRERGATPALSPQGQLVLSAALY